MTDYIDFNANDRQIEHDLQQAIEDGEAEDLRNGILNCYNCGRTVKSMFDHEIKIRFMTRMIDGEELYLCVDCKELVDPK